jgi:hypothetical protein
MTPKERRLQDERNRWAARNGELHVLAYEMLCELERLQCPKIHDFRQRLHAVPQLAGATSA